MLRDIYLRPKRNLDFTLHTVRAFFFGGGGGVKLCKTQPEGMAHVLSVVSAFLSSDCFFKVKFGLPLKFWYGQ